LKLRLKLPAAIPFLSHKIPRVTAGVNQWMRFVDITLLSLFPFGAQGCRSPARESRFLRMKKNIALIPSRFIFREVPMKLAAMETSQNATSRWPSDNGLRNVGKVMNQWERWFWRSEMKVMCRHYLSKQQLSNRSGKQKALCAHPFSVQYLGVGIVGRPVSCEGDRDNCYIPRGKRIV
jgi:hypothetical protein